MKPWTTLAAALFALAGCGDSANMRPAGLRPSGDVERGRLLLRQFGCSGCHRIPGVAGAPNHVGPPLDGWARRVYIAGLRPNTPPELAHWIQQPQAVAPGTAMPDMQVSSAQAHDMVAYLYTLR